ncbi:MAG: flagellar biosynthetic protein FliO [Pirellulales bacterium]
MICTFRPIALSLLAASFATPLSAEPTPGPPDWADARTSVYLGVKEPPLTQADQAASGEQNAIRASTADSPIAHAAPKIDLAGAPALPQAPAAVASESDNRRLPQPKGNSLGLGALNVGGPAKREAATSRRLVDFGVPFESIYTIVCALAIVIGAFLLFAWLMRRGGKNSTAALPPDVVSVLGRVPLATRQFAELLRVGNKLVLVSLTADGAETLTEVTDPMEVDRLIGLCQQYNPHSTTKAFEQVFRQLSRESGPSGFLGSDSLPQTISSAAAAYRAHRGDTARG